MYVSMHIIYCICIWNKALLWHMSRKICIETAGSREMLGGNRGRRNITPRLQYRSVSMRDAEDEEDGTAAGDVKFIIVGVLTPLHINSTHYQLSPKSF